jgi:Tol biopolymer transport system component
MKSIYSNKLVVLWALIGVTTLITLVSGCGSGGGGGDQTPTPTPAPSNTPNPQPSTQPTPPPASGAEKIAFHSDRDGGFTGIYTMNTDGTGSKRITGTEYSAFGNISKDGKKIVFTDGAGRSDNIYIIDANGGTETQLTRNAGANRSPKFSPDGTKITFVSNRDGNFEIYVMNADGSNQKRLTNNTVIDIDPSFSPDSTKVIMQRYRLNVDYTSDIYTISATDGSNETKITNNAVGLQSAEPCYSPNGTYIAFHKFRGRFVDTDPQVYIMDANGSNEILLTNASTGINTLPYFSPDSKKIVYNNYKAGNGKNEIYVVNINGTDLKNITNTLGDESYPSWGGISVAN